MTVTARRNQGPVAGSGAALPGVVSRDLVNWEVQPPLYAPSIGMNLEVTEAVRDGWPLLPDFLSWRDQYHPLPRGRSVGGALPVVRWMTSSLPNYMYAPRTIERQGKRYLIPWVADRLNGSDDNRSEFGAEGSYLGRRAGNPAGNALPPGWKTCSVLPGYRGGTVRYADAGCRQPRPSADGTRRMEAAGRDGTGVLRPGNGAGTGGRARTGLPALV